MVEYLSGGRIQCTELEKTNDSGNATLNGTSTNSATAINGVGSIDFDGTANDYIEFSQALTDELNTGTVGAWTFSCWVYVENTSTDQHTILSKIVAGYASPSHELNFRQAGSNWQLHFGTSFSGTNTQAIGHTGWTHLILSATNLGTTAVVWKLYVDNQASPVTVTGTEAILWNATTLLLFGRQNTSSSSERWFDGQAQEIAFWNKELDSSERSALFNSYAYGTATSSSNTGAKANTVATSSNLAYYTLNSSSVTNSSPNPSLGSDHPANTRLEVTDTRKIYRITSALTSSDATFTDNFTSSETDVWTHTESNYTSRTGNELKHTDAGVQWYQQTHSTYDLQTTLGSGTNAANTWVLRGKFKSTITGTNASLVFGLTDTDNADQASFGTSYWISAYCPTTTQTDQKLVVKNGTTSTTSSDYINLTANTYYWFELKKTSSTSASLKIYTSSSYSGSTIFDDDVTWTGSITGLRYIKLGKTPHGSQPSRYVVFDDIEFYNDVATVDSEWKERGTA